VFPAECACCGCFADATLAVSASRSSGKRVVHTKTNVWDIPYCSQCVAHVGAAAQSPSGITITLVLLSVILGFFLGYAVNLATGILSCFLAFVAIAFVSANLRERALAHARTLCSSNCVCVGQSVACLGWHGTVHEFEISSLRFATDFMLTNQGKLVNLSPQARDFLAQYGSASNTNAPRVPRRYMT
jgi:hypothetical protein